MIQRFLAGRLLLMKLNQNRKMAAVAVVDLRKEASAAAVETAAAAAEVVTRKAASIEAAAEMDITETINFLL